MSRAGRFRMGAGSGPRAVGCRPLTYSISAHAWIKNDYQTVCRDGHLGIPNPGFGSWTIRIQNANGNRELDSV